MVKYNPEKHHRRSIRLDEYDYASAGLYFVTICVHGRECVLGEIVDGVLRPSAMGRIVSAAWMDLPRHYPNVSPDVFCLMPNHIHGVILIKDANCRGGSVQARLLGPSATLSGSEPSQEDNQTRPVAVTHGLPEIVRAFKSFSARRINRIYRRPGIPFWQRNYYEHVIRNEPEWNKIREYIQTNALRWEVDQLRLS